MLGCGNGICKHLLALSKVLKKSDKLSTTELSSLLDIFTSSWRMQCCCVFSLQNSNNLIAKDFFVGVFANTYYLMLGLGDVENVVVKITVYVSLVQNLLWYFFKEE